MVPLEVTLTGLAAAALHGSDFIAALSSSASLLPSRVFFYRLEEAVLDHTGARIASEVGSEWERRLQEVPQGWEGHTRVTTRGERRRLVEAAREGAFPFQKAPLTSATEDLRQMLHDGALTSLQHVAHSPWGLDLNVEPPSSTSHGRDTWSALLSRLVAWHDAGAERESLAPAWASGEGTREGASGEDAWAMAAPTPAGATASQPTPAWTSRGRPRRMSQANRSALVVHAGVVVENSEVSAQRTQHMLVEAVQHTGEFRLALMERTGVFVGVAHMAFGATASETPTEFYGLRLLASPGGAVAGEPMVVQPVVEAVAADGSRATYVGTETVA